MNTEGWYTVRPDLRATATVMDFGEKGYCVTSIEVRQERGQGHASNLLKQITTDADREGATLFLSVEADGTGLNDDELRAWYTRHGFKSWPGSTSSMFRQPRRFNINPEPLRVTGPRVTEDSNAGRCEGFLKSGAGRCTFDARWKATYHANAPVLVCGVHVAPYQHAPGWKVVPYG